MSAVPVTEESVAEEIAKAVMGLPAGWRLDKPQVDHRPMKLRATRAKAGIRTQVFARDAEELAAKAAAVEASGLADLSSEIARIEYDARERRGGQA